MSYEVAIIADSVAPHGARITTYQLKYPRMIHSEFMTHRAVSRNASSTRAIPTEKMLKWVEEDPAMPVYWGKNQKVMQATEELPEEVVKESQWAWLRARDQAIIVARGLMNDGVHKQIASRVLEPFAHINVVATATDAGWMNFFALRCHTAAMPEIQVLAVKMARAYRDSSPNQVMMGGWHLPYVTPEDFMSGLTWEGLRKVSTARCARVSYKTFDGKKSLLDDDLKLHDTLEGNGHWSPPEHPATPAQFRSTRSGNFVGWEQYRQMLPKSVHVSFDFDSLDRFGDKCFLV